MNAYPSLSSLPDGVRYFADFVSADEETSIAETLDASDWSGVLKRRVQHFGYRYDYKARKVLPESYLGRFPDWLLALGERLVAHGRFKSLPDQVIANEYLPGQGISAHVDCEPCFGDTIVSISLLSSCEMVFRDRQSSQTRRVMLHPRSGILLSGEGRYNWTHEIPARKSDFVDGSEMNRARRISLTFRTVLPSPSI